MTKDPPPMKGENYRAMVRLSNAVDETLANPGDTCERVPVVSLASLLASGKITLVQRKRGS